MTEVYFSKTWSILGYHDTLSSPLLCFLAILKAPTMILSPEIFSRPIFFCLLTKCCNIKQNNHGKKQRYTHFVPVRKYLCIIFRILLTLFSLGGGRTLFARADLNELQLLNGWRNNHHISSLRMFLRTNSYIFRCRHCQLYDCRLGIQDGGLKIQNGWFVTS